MGTHPSQSRGQQWLMQLLQLANLPVDVVAEMHDDGHDHSCWLTIGAEALSEAQVTALIGDRGSVLDSIQYLANSTLNLGQSEEDQGAYVIELIGYRKQRQAELRAIADQAIQTVRETGQEYEIRSLSSAERRQIHTFLQDLEDLENFSRGQEPDRRLVVRPKSAPES